MLTLRSLTELKDDCTKFCLFCMNRRAERETVSTAAENSPEEH